MTGAHAMVALCVAFACLPLPSAAATASLAPPTASEGDQILARAKAVFRAHARPPFVAYTLVRRDTHDGVPDFENSYTLKVWCRTSDRSALTRRAWDGKAYGELENITVAFDKAVDPGPPTADIFERALFGARVTAVEGSPSPPAPPSSGATPRPSGPPPIAPQADASALPTIGGISVASEYDYHVSSAKRDGAWWHLVLEPKRDAERNRLDDLWVDASSYEIARMRVRDHLYLGLSAQTIDDEFDVRFTQRDGLPVIASIHGQTKYGQFETDYRYGDVTFPAELPAWYFEPKTYRAHRADAPA